MIAGFVIRSSEMVLWESVTARTYTTTEICALTRASQREIQWWAERHLLRPDYHGHNRVWNTASVVEAWIICQLRRKSMSLSAIRKIMSRLRGHIGRHGLGHFVLVGGDGRPEFVATQDLVVERIKQIPGPCFLAMIEFPRREP